MSAATPTNRLLFAHSAGSSNRGYNIGTRIIDEFLAKSGVPQCSGFKDACETCAKVGRCCCAALL